jgi:hypothetical protein
VALFCEVSVRIYDNFGDIFEARTFSNGAYMGNALRFCFTPG